MPLIVIILTLNEELHIARAIGSVKGIADRILVVDSGSIDRTTEIARTLGAEVLIHPFETHARQFNWALSQLPLDTEWVFRLDADEIVSPELAKEIIATLPKLGTKVCGVELNRRIAFMGRPIRWGGLFPVRILRIFRFGSGRSEDRWMDEHILVDGQSVLLSGELLDDNRNTLTWWIAKHNAYASREVVEMLDAEYHFLNRPLEQAMMQHSAGRTRWLKKHFYAHLPGSFRALAYFLYRYIFRLGFLDGIEGSAFHVLQGFWYRYLVDMKLHEVKTYMKKLNTDSVSAIEAVLGLRVSSAKPDSLVAE